MITWLKGIGITILAFLAPIHLLMICVGILIGADFITGIARAVKKKQKITSNAMKRTVVKSLIYQVAVISGFALETIMPGGLPIAKLVASAIALVEFKSIAENVQGSTGIDLVAVIKKVSSNETQK